MSAFPLVQVLNELLFALGITVLLILTQRSGTEAHNLGLHGLSGANPSGDPPLPSIQGVFETELKVRFNDVTTGTYHNLFEYSDDDELDTIWFGQLTLASADQVFFSVKAGGLTSDCIRSNAGMVIAGTIHTYKFGVDTSNTTRIFMDGSLVGECTNMLVPRNVPRNHYVGSGPLDSFPSIDRTMGAILGVRVTNLLIPQDPGSAFALHNFPSQTFSSPFVASFYARFDVLEHESRWFQRVFDFGNGERSNNILCGQFRETSSMFCEVYDGATFHRIRAGNSLVQGQFAFWHFGIDHVSGNDQWLFWIEKDGVRLKEENKTLQVQHVFRKGLLFGESHWPGDGDLEGAVLGLRLDRGGPIS